MKNKVNIYIILSIVLIAMLMFGCTRRDLEMRPDNGYLKINLHWKQSSVPGVTTYYFYNSRGGEPLYPARNPNSTPRRSVIGICPPTDKPRPANFPVRLSSICIR